MTLENADLLSVIIPVYNSALWLRDCIDSILRSVSDATQQIRIILIDDGSTDGSEKICNEYAQRFPFIQCVHQKNSGVSAARNMGLQLASGKYIAWVDSDDTVAEEWYPEIRNVIDQYGPDAIVFDSIRQEKEKNVAEIYGRAAGNVSKETLLSDLARDIRLLSGLPNKVIRAECFQMIEFGEEKILEDYNRIFKILDAADSFYYIPKVLYYYRQQESSITHSSTPAQSYYCVEAALRRKETLPPRYQKAGTTGVAVQMVHFARHRGFDKRFLALREEYRMCIKYVRKHRKELLSDAETPTIWKFKFWLLSIGVLPVIGKIKVLLKEKKPAHFY